MAGLHKDLKDRKVTQNRHILWSDGCAAQYKSAGAFWDRMLGTMLYNVDVEHHFFGSGHGKGEHDGAGAHVKHHARLALVQGDVVFRCAKDMVKWCTDELSAPKSTAEDSFASRNKSIRLDSRHFHLLDVGDVVHQDKSIADTIPQTRSHHSWYFPMVSREGKRTVIRRQYSCFCVHCMAWPERVEHQGELGFMCPTNSHVLGECSKISLTSDDPVTLGTFDTILQTTYPDAFPDLIFPSDDVWDKLKPGKPDSKPAVTDFYCHMAVHADVSDGAPFHIFRVVSKPKVLETAQRDRLGEEYAPGTRVVEGFWYDVASGCKDFRSYSYRGGADNLALLDCDTAFACGFTMEYQRGTKSYVLSASDYGWIMGLLCTDDSDDD